jgi:hypothetical protein
MIDLGAMVFGMPRALFPALAVTLYGGGAATVGYLNAAVGLGALAGSLLTGHIWRVRRPGRSVAVCVVLWGLAITGFGLVRWLPAALALLVVAGAADVVSSVFRAMIVQQVTPDAMQGRVNSLIFAGLQGGPRLGDAEAGAAAAVAGVQFAAWSGGVLSVVTAVVTCWAIPQFWRYRSGGVAAVAQSSAPTAPSGDAAAGPGGEAAAAGPSGDGSAAPGRQAADRTESPSDSQAVPDGQAPVGTGSSGDGRAAAAGQPADRAGSTGEAEPGPGAAKAT